MQPPLSPSSLSKGLMPVSAYLPVDGSPLWPSGLTHCATLLAASSLSKGLMPVSAYLPVDGNPLWPSGLTHCATLLAASSLSKGLMPVSAYLPVDGNPLWPSGLTHCATLLAASSLSKGIMPVSAYMPVDVPVGPVEIFFSWSDAVLGNFYWPGARGPLLASSPGQFQLICHLMAILYGQVG